MTMLYCRNAVLLSFHSAVRKTLHCYIYTLFSEKMSRGPIKIPNLT